MCVIATYGGVFRPVALTAGAAFREVRDEQRRLPASQIDPGGYIPLAVERRTHQRASLSHFEAKEKAPPEGLGGGAVSLWVASMGDPTKN
jgi:hypothetical protein